MSNFKEEKLKELGTRRTEAYEKYGGFTWQELEAFLSQALDEQKARVIKLITELEPDGLEVNYEENNFAAGQRDALLDLKGRITEEL